MGQLTIKYANPLGDYDQKFGQRYWGKAHDTDMDIAFNLMNPINFEDGDEIEFEEKVIKEKGENSKNPGEEYLFLKKVKRVGESTGSQGGGEGKPAPRATNESKSPTASEPLPYEAGTNARWALKLAMDTYRSVVGGMPDSQADYDQILRFAKWLLVAFDELKTGKPAEPKGIEKVRATVEAIKAKSGKVENVTGKPGYEIPFDEEDEEDEQV